MSTVVPKFSTLEKQYSVQFQINTTPFPIKEILFLNDLCVECDIFAYPLLKCCLWMYCLIKDWFLISVPGTRCERFWGHYLPLTTNTRDSYSACRSRCLSLNCIRWGEGGLGRFVGKRGGGGGGGGADISIYGSFSLCGRKGCRIFASANK